jgi:hypothetical protein
MSYSFKYPLKKDSELITPVLQCALVKAAVSENDNVKKKVNLNEWLLYLADGLPVCNEIIELFNKRDENNKNFEKDLEKLVTEYWNKNFQKTKDKVALEIVKSGFDYLVNNPKVFD